MGLMVRFRAEQFDGDGSTKERWNVHLVIRCGTVICAAHSGLNGGGGLRTWGVAPGLHIAGPLARNRRKGNAVWISHQTTCPTRLSSTCDSAPHGAKHVSLGNALGIGLMKPPRWIELGHRKNFLAHSITPAVSIRKDVFSDNPARRSRVRRPFTKQNLAHRQNLRMHDSVRNPELSR